MGKMAPTNPRAEGVWRGWPLLCKKKGLVMKLLPFQRQFLAAVANPKYDTVVLSGPRSLGKTFIAGKVLEHCMTPGDPDVEGPLTQLKKDLAKSKGGVTFAETTRSGNGDLDSRPAKDWVQERYGFSPPDTLAALRSDAGMAIIAACGLSVALWDGSDGTSKREALRQAVTTAYLPLGRLISTELSAKLGLNISLSFTDLWGHDAVGRSQALKI